MKARHALTLGGLIAVICSGCVSEETGGTTSDGATVESPASYQASGPDSEGLYDPTESMFKTAECLQADGWDVTIDYRRGLEGYETSVSTDQEDALTTAEAECQSKFPAREQTPMEEWGDEEWQDAYDSELTTAECLRNEGYEVPEAPSLETYREGLMSPPESGEVPTTSASSPWSAYRDINVGKSEWERLNMACPQG